MGDWTRCSTGLLRLGLRRSLLDIGIVSRIPLTCENVFPHKIGERVRDGGPVIVVPHPRNFLMDVGEGPRLSKPLILPELENQSPASLVLTAGVGGCQRACHCWQGGERLALEGGEHAIYCLLQLVLGAGDLDLPARLFELHRDEPTLFFFCRHLKSIAQQASAHVAQHLKQ